MDIQYKPSKPKKEKPAKAPKAPKAEKAFQFNSSVQTMKPSKPKKEKPVKAPKPEKAKAMSFGKTEKIQTDKPMKVEKAKKSGPLSKIDPKLILGAFLVLLAAVAVVVWTVVIPAVEERGMQIDSIKITRKPDKLIYLAGEEADYDGLRVTVTRKNGETFIARANDCEITGFDSKNPLEKCIVTVNYAGFTDLFSVTIKENEKPAPVLKSIRLDPMPKTEYKSGEWLDTSGAYIIREYMDGSTVTVNMLKTDVYGWDKVKGPGTYELTVKYAENGVLATCTYTITVTG